MNKKLVPLLISLALLASPFVATAQSAATTGNSTNGSTVVSLLEQLVATLTKELQTLTATTSSAQSAAAAVAAAPTATVYANTSSATIGQPDTIYLSATVGAGDTLTSDSITMVPPTGTSSVVARSGTGSSSSARPTLGYTFTPTAPGTYYFYPSVTTSQYPTATVPQQYSWFSVVVTPTPAPTMSLSASAASVPLGTPVTVTAGFTAAAGDAIVSDAIDWYKSGSSTINIDQSGRSTRTTLQNPLSFTFTPTAPGTYVFKPYVTSSEYPSWATASSSQQTVTVPASLSMSISASNTSIAVGQSTTITASFTPGAGDTLVDTGIGESGILDSVLSSGAGQGESLQNPLSYTFTPTAPGTYQFFPEGTTHDYPAWATAPSSQWVTITVTGVAETLQIQSTSTPTTVTITRSGFATSILPWTENPPWTLQGGWHSYFLSTGWSYFCGSPDSLTSLSVSLSAQYCSGLSSHAVLNRDWERTYAGIQSAYVLNAGTPNALILEAIHGENKNEISDFYYGGEPVQNDINTNVSESSCASGYVNGVYQDCAAAYNGFVSMAQLPDTAASGWGQTASTTTTDDGPIVWPENGYLNSQGVKMSQGVVVPTFFASGGYLYVYFVDKSYDSNFGSIKVARAPLSSLPNPNAFYTYYQGGFFTPALPAGFSASNISSFYTSKVPSDPILPKLSNAAGYDLFRFSVASINNTNLFIGVLEYSTSQGTDNDALMISSDLVHWSNPTVIVQSPTWAGNDFEYPIFLDSTGSTNTAIDLNNFYIEGTDGSANVHLMHISASI